MNTCFWGVQVRDVLARALKCHALAVEAAADKDAGLEASVAQAGVLTLLAWRAHV